MTGGAWLTPGLIDCHTHIVYGGDRTEDFRRRLRGESYAQIARAGGGIMSTVRATRAASTEELTRSAVSRARELSAWGVTTIEVKSGYGLDRATELRMLDVAAALPRHLAVDVSPTLLAAHAVPLEYTRRRGDYVEMAVREILPAALEQGHAKAVDVFCEDIAFTADEARRVLETGIASGLHGRLHADQLSDLGGGTLAADVGARSADHLEYLSRGGVEAMASADVCAVLLPGAAYTLGADRRPPVSALRRAGVTMALATDANPGSSPITHVGLVLNLACIRFGMTPEEALLGFTAAAGKVLGLQADRGTIEVGKRADFAAWDVDDLSWLCYRVGPSPLKFLVKDGVPVESAEEQGQQ
ncbi:MAG: imidazolonepropionase [Gemmatimonadota bacterium]|nr:imidazolonepropionase [Gemmatimonadota bacterium]MDE2865179.1 imidazolonepropionase [Gemmatimonadota bacterium]